MLNSIDMSGMWISNSATHITGVCGLHIRVHEEFIMCIMEV